MSVTQRRESEPWRASVSRNRSALSPTGPQAWSWRASRCSMAASAVPTTETTARKRLPTARWLRYAGPQNPIRLQIPFVLSGNWTGSVSGYGFAERPTSFVVFIPLYTVIWLIIQISSNSMRCLCPLQQPDRVLCPQEIRYLDQVLDAASETPTNGTSYPSDHHTPISVDRSSPSVCVSGSPPVNHQHIIVEGHRQTTFVHQDDSLVRTNGHGQGEEPGSGRAKFELRAFQEERRPAKLFTPGEEQHIRVTRTRPTEEVGSRPQSRLIKMDDDKETVIKSTNVI